MSIEQWLALFAFGVTLGGYVMRMSYRLGTLAIKVDTLWEFLMKRGTIEGLERGFLKANSPLAVTPEIRAAFDPIMEELLTFYPADGHKMKDLDLMFEMERRFSNKIIEAICIPLHVTNGACLVIAAKLLRDGCEVMKP